MVGLITRKLVTFLCALTVMGFLFTDMVACLTILLGFLGRDYEAAGVGVLAAVVFGYATWKFFNIFVDRMAPPDNVNWNE